MRNTQALGDGATLFVSIAAGTTIAAFEAALGARTPIVRTMPNTPAMVNRGITALCRNGHVSDGDMALAVALMAAVEMAAVARLPAPAAQAQLERRPPVREPGPTAVRARPSAAVRKVREAVAK